MVITIKQNHVWWRMEMNKIRSYILIDVPNSGSTERSVQDVECGCQGGIYTDGNVWTPGVHHVLQRTQGEGSEDTT